MRGLLDDLRFSIRLLRRAPAMSAAVMASLALGIAANTAVFSFVNAVQFKPLPVADEARLVDLSETSRTELCAGCAVGTSYPTYLDWKAAATSFETFGAYREERFVVSGPGGPDRVGGALASAELFPMLGVRPSMGREFEPADDAPGAAPVVILSDVLWRSRFAADPDIIGSSAKVNGVARTVVGVMPPGFRFPEFAQVWLPLAPAAGEWARGDRSLSVVARLRRGVSLDVARAEMATLAAAQAVAHPATHGRWSATAVSLREDLTAETATASVVLLGAVAFVLLIACANVANLLLAQALARRRELAVRLALGATRMRVIRLVLAESLVLAAGGGAAGLLAALWLAGAVVAAVGMDAPYWIQFGVDWRVFAFCGLITVVAACLCGIAPAMQAARPQVAVELKEGEAASGGRGARRIRHTLIVGQLALALVLLACAGLLIKTVARTFRFDAGFDTSKVVVGDLNLEGPAFASPRAITALTATLFERLDRPGLTSAVSRTVFFAGFGAEARRMSAEGVDVVPAGASPRFYFAVSDDYFAVRELRLRAGRTFAAGDSDAVVVNVTLAQRLWGDRNPLGARIRFGDAASRAPWLTVVGVVESEGTPLSARVAAPAAYVPFAAHPGREFALYVRTSGIAAELIPEVRAAVRSVDPDLPVEDLMTMEQMFAAWSAPARFVATLMTSLSAVALLLACIGIYGVMTYAIRQRSREIGVRLALGATPRQVRTLMARRGAGLVAVGIVIGAAGAWVSTRMLEGVLAGTSPTDPVVFASVAAILGAIGCLASWLPARKAAAIDPLAVLRQS
jgi:predicted permease